MRGPPSEYAAPPIYVYPAGPKPGIHFSRTELFQLTVAILALSASFTILYIRPQIPGFLANPVLFLALFFPASLLAVGTGVGLHEIMHKIVAQRYGLWAEFRYNLSGLAFAFLFAATVGVLFGAPGATWISGAVTREQNGRISAAGPLTNITIATILIIVSYALFSRFTSGFGGLILSLYLVQAATVNAFLGFFNLIPVMPLDGAKVLAWNKGIYAATMIGALALVGLTFFPALF
jgi:Zn-dependent protease